MEEITRSEARMQLDQWAANDSHRDRIVLQALAAGIPATEIHDRTGLARTTITRISQAAFAAAAAEQPDQITPLDQREDDQRWAAE